MRTTTNRRTHGHQQLAYFFGLLSQARRNDAQDLEWEMSEEEVSYFA